MENKFRNLVSEPTIPSFAKGKFIEAPEHQRHRGRREPRCPTRQRLSNRWHASLDSLDRRSGANALAQQGVQSSSELARWLAVAPCATLNPRSSPKWSNNLGVLRQTPESGGGGGSGSTLSLGPLPRTGPPPRRDLAVHDGGCQTCINGTRHTDFEDRATKHSRQTMHLAQLPGHDTPWRRNDVGVLKLIVNL